MFHLPAGFSVTQWDCWDRERDRLWISEYGSDSGDGVNSPMMMWDYSVWADGKHLMHTLHNLADQPNLNCTRSTDDALDATLRGLLIHSEHLDRILSGEKTYEIRNMGCKCVPVGGEFYLLRVFPHGQGRNIHGQCCVEVAGTAILKGCHFIKHDAFSSLHHLHRVTQEQYDNMRKVWKKDHGGCYAWELELGFVFNPPRYLPSGNQDGQKD